MTEHEVPIKIDKSNLKILPMSTGNVLYQLGSVGGDYDLWLEVPGPAEDLFVPNSGSALSIKPGSHFYTVKKTLNPGNV